MIKEAAYKGNIGAMEMIQLYQKASPKQIEQIEQIVKDEDWEAFRKMVKKVLNVNLK